MTIIRDAIKAVQHNLRSFAVYLAFILPVGLANLLIVAQGGLLAYLAAAGEAPVATVFVNPTQFGPGEDYEAYPRDLEDDLERLRPLGVRGVFAPPVHEVYGSGREVTVLPGDRAEGLCGAGRPGHFAGVLTVVAKLFGMVRPDVAVFGRKDAQQCLVIAQMVDDLKMGIRLVDAPTVREADGLAMSSRNTYLGDDQRKAAGARGALCRVAVGIQPEHADGENQERAAGQQRGCGNTPRAATGQSAPAQSGDGDCGATVPAAS